MQVLKEGILRKPWNGGKVVCEECGAIMQTGIEDLVRDGSSYHIYCPFCDESVASFKKEALPADRLEEIDDIAKKNRFARANSIKERIWIEAEFMGNMNPYLFAVKLLILLLVPFVVMTYVSFPIGFILEVLVVIMIHALLSA